MRAHRAATVFIRINEGSKGNRTFDSRVKLNAEFSNEVQIRSETRRHDQFVNGQMTSATTGPGANGKTGVTEGQMRDTKFAFDCYFTRCDQRGEGSTKCAAR